MIEIEGIWKQYQLGNTVDFNKSFREMVTQRFSRRAQVKVQEMQEAQLFWALRDVNLSVQSGRSLGLIGHNGAGKSTLLKVLSRITRPTRGKITIHGSISSLLEVGTGFHPELSGRENIYLYGAIMGMSRQDIRLKFDEIVDYAGVEQFLDTPVKRYSSGMYVRLAFSIAAHVDPDILVVDEVLAVGDRQFREKCIGKMDDVAQSGRTVIFVSHNMGAIASLCKEAVWMDHGQIKTIGATKEVVSAYENDLLASTSADRASSMFQGTFKGELVLEQLDVQAQPDAYQVTIDSEQALHVKILWRANEDLSKLVVTLGLFHKETRLFSIDDCPEPCDAKEGFFESDFHIPADVFCHADLSISVGAVELRTGRWCWAPKLSSVTVINQTLRSSNNDEDLLMSPGSGQRLANTESTLLARV